MSISSTTEQSQHKYLGGGLPEGAADLFKNFISAWFTTLSWVKIAKTLKKVENGQKNGQFLFSASQTLH